MDLHLVIAGGLFSLGGVLLGGLLTPLTQLFLERKRERRVANRAKLLVAAELLHAQMTLRSVSNGEHWPPIEDLNAFLPTSAWRDNQSSLAGNMSEDLWVQIVMAYVLLEIDRSRFAVANKFTEPKPLDAELAAGMKKSSDDLGRLRRLRVAPAKAQYCNLNIFKIVLTTGSTLIDSELILKEIPHDEEL